MLEQTPAKYDRGMRLLTLGRIDLIKRQIASSWVEPGCDVLEIGSGTGTLAAMMTGGGGHVVGIDISEAMLAEARKSAPNAEFLHITATEIGTLGTERFDRIVATLSFSELCEDELDYVLRLSAAALKPGGRLVVADEILPDVWWQRIIFYLLRWPLAALTFLLTQNTTHALKAFESRLKRAGYRIIFRRRYLLGTLALIAAEKA